MKLLIIGSARWGKDSCAEILRDTFGLRFNSSSLVASKEVVYWKLKDQYGYGTSAECYEDRANHRKEWYDLIREYNKDDRARLAKKVLESADCYVGMRDIEEFKACMSQNLFDLVIWVDASLRLPPESKDSFNIGKEVADIIVDNNGTFSEFENRVKRLGKVLFK